VSCLGGWASQPSASRGAHGVHALPTAKSSVFFLPKLAALADELGCLVLRIDRQQVAEAELVPGGILQRLLIQSLRGRQVCKRVKHGEEDSVASRVVWAAKHHKRHIVP